MTQTLNHANAKKDTRVITGMVRLSFAHIWEPSSIDGIAPPKYSVSLLIPKSDTRTIASIKKAINAAVEAGLATKFGGKRPVSPKQPLRDGDEEKPEDPVYAGHYFVNATSKTAPGIVDVNRQEIMDPELLQSGDYARVSINFYAFNTSGNRGIACGLGNIMKLKDGERLGGKVRVEDDFNDDFDVTQFYGDDDFLN